MENRLPLFRKESFESRQLEWLGSPVITNDVPTSFFAIASLAIFVLIVFFSIGAEYTRRVTVAGVILPTEGLTRVSSPNYGWVTRLYVGKGELVEEGDILYEINLDSATSLGNTQETIRQLREQQRNELISELHRREELSQQEKQSLINRRDNIMNEIEQLGEQIETTEEFARTLHDFAMEQKEYLDRGLTPSQAFESRLQAYMEYQESSDSLKRQHVQLNTELASVRDELASFDLNTASSLGELRRQIISIDQNIAEVESKKSVRVLAPRDGVVDSVSTYEGQTVANGTPLLTIIPNDADLKAQMLIPSQDIGFLKEGGQVFLRYSAFPYQKFGQYPGTVSEISRSPLKQDEINMLVDSGAAPPSSSSIYRIIVDPESDHTMVYGDHVNLQAGMQAEANIMVDTRPLYQWIFEPLYGVLRFMDAQETER